MKKRIVPNSTVLGIGDHTFRLVEGEEIEVFEANKYGRVRVNLQGQEVSISRSMLERISNWPPEEIVYGEEQFVGKIPERDEIGLTCSPEKTHYYLELSLMGLPGPLCGSLQERGMITKDRDRVTCKKCLLKLKEMENNAY